jgi:hypothetical protein
MKPLADRLRDFVKVLRADGYCEDVIEDLQLAARFVEMKDGDPHPLKSVPTLLEERIAWDRYAAALLTDASSAVDHEIETTYAADGADDLLEERRKRFGVGK